VFTSAARKMTTAHSLAGLARLAFFAGVLLASLARAANGEQAYAVSGTDTFKLGSTQNTEIAYRGHESLTLRRSGSKAIFRATAQYHRKESGQVRESTAVYEAELSPTGEQRDLEDGDPDSLTILNQPFSVRLDTATLRDLGHLHHEAPFEYASPITGSTLHGSLRTIGTGRVAGFPSLGVSFEAGGPMRGPVPGRPGMSLGGKIRLQGQAYYRTEDGLLVMLSATLTLSGNVANPEQTDPVRIEYRRTIRAER
jgi:hypothetical protein